MQTVRVSFGLSLLTLCLCTAVLAQQAGRIESMKLLTADVGWAATSKKLYWTTDGGASWKDVTPKLNHKHQAVSSVFFLDGSTGWALLSCSDSRDLVADASCFELASTTDAGSSWSVLNERVKLGFTKAQLEEGYGFSGRSWLYFVDPLHGWEILDVNTSPASPSAGEMLRTEDGGKTWAPTRDTPTSDHFLFVNTTEGWIAGGKEGDLFVTHDAGDNWQKIELAVPKGIPPDLSPVYGLPAFDDANNGHLAATYEGSTSTGTPLVLFETGDGGKTWRPTAKTDPLPDAHPWAPHPSSIVGGGLLVAAASSGRVDLTRVVRGTEPKTQTARSPVPASIVDELSFPNLQRGWILASYWLLSTEDGGVSWRDVTPYPKLTVPPLAFLDRGTAARYAPC